MQLRKRSSQVNYTENGSPTSGRTRRSASAAQEARDNSGSEDEGEFSEEDSSARDDSEDSGDFQSAKKPSKRKYPAGKDQEKERRGTKSTGWNAGEGTTSQSSNNEDDDSEGSDDFVAERQKYKKRKIPAEPRARLMRTRRAEAVNYKDASSSEDGPQDSKREGGRSVEKPGHLRKGNSRGSDRSSPEAMVDDDEEQKSSKPSTRKKGVSDDIVTLSHPSGESIDSPVKDGAEDGLKCYTRRSKNKFVVASDDEDDTKPDSTPSRNGSKRNHEETGPDGNLGEVKEKIRNTGRQGSESNKDPEVASDSVEELPVQTSASDLFTKKYLSKSSGYSVDTYGLWKGDHDYGPLAKRISKVEKILAVRNRSAGVPVYCVKLHGLCYRSAVNVPEARLLNECPQLLRPFLKRMEVLGRVDGHPGDFATSPAFNPMHLKVDRVVAMEKHGRVTRYLVKWGGLPYSEATWETEDKLANDKEAIKRYVSFNRRKKSQPKSSSSKLFFKDGRILRNYQEEGVSWLGNKYQNQINCILADEMGLGKTIQSVAMLETLRLKHGIQGPFLVVAPVSTLGHWQREVESLTDMNCVVYSGNQEDREIIRQYEFKYEGGKKSSDMKFNVLLTSFEMLMKDQNKLAKIRWQFIIVDEAHRLKSRDSKTTLSLKQMNISSGGLLLLTGTPVQNNVKEIFSLLNLLDPESFDSEEEFLSKYGDLKNAEQVKDLQDNVLRPRLLRRMKEDVEKSIPQKEETIVWVELTRDQRIYYRAIYENSINVLLKGSSGANAPSLRNVAMELRKVCNHPLLCDGVEENLIAKHFGSKVGCESVGNDPDLVQKRLQQASGKMVLVDKLLPMLKEAGRRVLIFSQFTMMLDLLEDYLVAKGYTYERIDGNIRGTDRQAAIDRYSAKESDIFVFLLSTRAGGLGITLTAADTCLIYDSDWNPQNDLQAMARCHRIGQTKDVKIYRLITRNTYEQKLFECSSRKYGLDEAILGNRLGADGDLEQSVNIESLLKHGAYDMLKDDGEADAAEFSAQNIHQILEQRTQKRLIGGRGVNTFSVATFVSNPEVDTELVDESKHLEKGTKEFWQELLPEAVKASEIPVQKVQVPLPLGSRRKRAQTRVDYREDPKTASEDEANESGGSGRESPTEESSLSIESDEEDRLHSWSEREVKRLEDRLMILGRGRAVQIQLEAQLEHRDLQQIEQVCQIIIQLCYFLETNKSVTQVSSVPQKSPDMDVQDQKPHEGEKSAEIGGGLGGLKEIEAEGVLEILPLGCVLVNDYDSRVNYRRDGCILIGDKRRPPIPFFVRKAMKSRMFNERIAKNFSRYLQMLLERDILANAIARNDRNYLPPKVAVRSKKIPSWWGTQEDLDLMIGVNKHGHREFKKVRMDPCLCFAKRSSTFGHAHGQVVNGQEPACNSGMDVNGDSNPLQDGVQGGDWPPDSALAARLKKLIQLLPKHLVSQENSKPNLPRPDKRRTVETSGHAEKCEPGAPGVVTEKVSVEAVRKIELDVGIPQPRSESTIAEKENEIPRIKPPLPNCDKKDAGLENGVQRRITGYFFQKAAVAT